MEQSTSELVTNLIKDALWKEIGNAIDMVGQILGPVLKYVISTAVTGILLKILLVAILRAVGFSKRMTKKLADLIINAKDIISTLK